MLVLQSYLKNIKSMLKLNKIRKFGEKMSFEKIVKRGFVQKDEIQFNLKSLDILKKAKEEIFWLINKGYPIKNVSTFVGNHYNLSERQRLALVRIISPESSLKIRKEKQIVSSLEGLTVHIDGFNQIITLEVYFSKCTLLKCMDNTIRDLAGLRGTYKIIDKTKLAILSIGNTLQNLKIRKAIIYLDSPVSSSGKLKQSILQCFNNYTFDTDVIIVNNVDSILQDLNNVITSDSIILDNCKSWFNLNEIIIDNKSCIIL